MKELKNKYPGFSPAFTSSSGHKKQKLDGKTIAVHKVSVWITEYSAG